jgi:hypothetical protein
MKLLLVILFLFSGCGDSPLLNTEPAKKKNENIQFQSTVSFSNLRGTQADSRGNDLSKNEYDIQGIWQIGPNLKQENKILVLITDEDGNRIDLPLEIEPYIWMPDMGHGSFPIKVTRIETGLIELSEIFFTMGGYWDFILEFKSNDKIIDEVKWPLNL